MSVPVVMTAIYEIRGVSSHLLDATAQAFCCTLHATSRAAADGSELEDGASRTSPGAFAGLPPPSVISSGDRVARREGAS